MIGMPSSQLPARRSRAAPAVVDRSRPVEQALPRVDPHQVADPERRDEQDEDQRPCTSSRVSRHEVRDGVADHEADRARGEHVRRTCGAAAPDRSRRRRRTCCRVSLNVVERPPPRLVVRAPAVRSSEVDRAERDREHDVERQHEQHASQRVPGAANDGQYHRGYQTPRPAPARSTPRRAPAARAGARSACAAVADLRPPAWISVQASSQSCVDLGRQLTVDQARLEHLLGHDRVGRGSPARRRRRSGWSGSIDVNGGW